MKKFLIKSICLVLVTVTTFSLCGCSVVNYPEEFVVGDFRVRYLSIYEEKDPDAYLCLVGLSKEGEQKKTIVLPKRIDGHPYRLHFKGSTSIYNSSLFIGKVEKFYLEYTEDYSEDLNYVTDYSEDKMLKLIPLRLYGCTNLKKVFSNIILDVVHEKESSLRYFNYYSLCFFYQETYKRKCEKLSIDTEGWMDGARLANLQYMYNFG